MEEKLAPPGLIPPGSPYFNEMTEEEKRGLLDRIIDAFVRAFRFIFGGRAQPQQDKQQHNGTELGEERRILSSAERTFAMAFAPMSSVDLDDVAGQARARLPSLGSIYLTAKKILGDREQELSGYLTQFNEHIGPGAAWSLENVRDLLSAPENALCAEEFVRLCGGQDAASKLVMDLDQARSDMAESAAAFRMLAGHVRERGILSAEECQRFEDAFPDRESDSGVTDDAISDAVGPAGPASDDGAESPSSDASSIAAGEGGNSGRRRFPVIGPESASVVDMDAYRDRP